MFKGIMYAAKASLLLLGAYAQTRGMSMLSDTDTNFGWYGAIALGFVGVATLITYGFYLVKSFTKDFDAHEAAIRAEYERNTNPSLTPKE